MGFCLVLNQPRVQREWIVFEQLVDHPSLNKVHYAAAHKQTGVLCAWRRGISAEKSAFGLAASVALRVLCLRLEGWIVKQLESGHNKVIPGNAEAAETAGTLLEDMRAFRRRVLYGGDAKQNTLVVVSVLVCVAYVPASAAFWGNRLA